MFRLMIVANMLSPLFPILLLIHKFKNYFAYIILIEPIAADLPQGLIFCYQPRSC